ncbi:MAG: hypothetical protein K8Q91_02660 [Candidatus Vogelbacteria bacterium]|nr:hypothetical protein [Candidatus Vogelbacteria bacterium]
MSSVASWVTKKHPTRVLWLVGSAKTLPGTVAVTTQELMDLAKTALPSEVAAGCDSWSGTAFVCREQLRPVLLELFPDLATIDYKGAISRFGEVMDVPVHQD